MPASEIDFDKNIGYILRVGVTTAFIIIAIGSALLFAEGQTGYAPLSSSSQVYSSRFALGLGSLVQGLVSAKPFAIIELGLILLFATPVSRVFISIFLFLEEKRYIFVAITLFVLFILLLSTFVIGPLLSSGN